MVVIYASVEERLKDINLSSTSLDLDQMILLESTKGNILFAEDTLSMVANIVKDVPRCYVIIDSYSSLYSKTEADKGVDGQTRGGPHKALTNFFKELKGVVPTNEAIIVGITHEAPNLGYGGGTLEKTNTYLRYQCDTKIRVRKTEDWMDGENIIGHQIDWKCLFSALGSTNKNITGFHRFGSGIDYAAECANLGIEYGLIDKAGAWFSYNEQKFQGINKLINFVQENEEIQKELYNTLMELLVGKQQ